MDGDLQMTVEQMQAARQELQTQIMTAIVDFQTKTKMKVSGIELVKSQYVPERYASVQSIEALIILP